MQSPDHASCWRFVDTLSEQSSCTTLHMPHTCHGPTQLERATFRPRRCLPAAVAAGAPGHCAALAAAAFAKSAAAVSASTDAAAIAFALATAVALDAAAAGAVAMH